MSKHPNGSITRIVYTPWKISYYDSNDNDDSSEGLARGHFNTPRNEKYDAWLRMIEVSEIVDGTELRTHYRYDVDGKILQIIDAAGRITLDVQYDLSGRKIAINHIDTGLQRYLYDAEGKVIWEENAKRDIVYRDYDGVSRLKTIDTAILP